MDVTVVEKEMREAAERRAFVVDELLEAGYRGEFLLDVVLRLTTLSPEDARALIRTHAADLSDTPPT